MKIIRDTRHRSITLRFGPSLELRDAIGLPALIARLGRGRRVRLDFSRVRSARGSAFAALIPALASLHRPVAVIGGAH